MKRGIGVYCIINKINDKVYIGYANNFSKRWYRQHRKKLKYNLHKNPHLQAAWNKYGEENFKFERIEICKQELLKEREDYWCKIYKSHDREFGYNIRPTGKDGCVSMSEETKQKIRNARSKQVITQKHKNAISDGLKGYRRSTEEYWKSYKTKQERGIIKPVIQMDMQENVIKEWESNAIASAALNLPRSCISAVCNNKPHANTAGGFKWKFKK